MVSINNQMAPYSQLSALSGYEHPHDWGSQVSPPKWSEGGHWDLPCLALQVELVTPSPTVPVK